MWHASRVKRDPRRSPVHALDLTHRANAAPLDASDARFTGRHKAVLATFALSLLVLVWGVFPRERVIEGIGTVYGLSYFLGGEGWYIIEIAAFFLGLGALLAALGGLSPNRAAGAFMEGVKDLAPTAVIIGIARGILVVLEDGQAIDPILHALASGLEGTGSAASAMAMFAAQTLINFFVPSGSGQAALTMPLMAPLADLVGVTRQTAVLAFQMGDGFTNMIIPTSAVLMGVLSLARIPWPTWARWVLPLAGSALPPRARCARRGVGRRVCLTRGVQAGRQRADRDGAGASRRPRLWRQRRTCDGEFVNATCGSGHGMEVDSVWSSLEGAPYICGPSSFPRLSPTPP